LVELHCTMFNHRSKRAPERRAGQKSTTDKQVEAHPSFEVRPSIVVRP